MRRPGGKYLTFSLAGEEYGIGILKVREIIGMMPFTPVPQTPDFVKGVINLRGKVIPVVDLRLKFGMRDHRLRRADLHHRGGGRGRSGTSMGIVVDAVNEVTDIKAEEWRPPPISG